MWDDVAIIGFGEAGAAFARPGAHAYDRKTDDAAARETKQADYARACVTGFATAADALDGARAVLSLVTANEALAAALGAAPVLGRDALWLDMNSVAPNTKRDAARAIEAAGGRYVDVAIMSPVSPKRLAVPLLVSGPHAEAGVARLRQLGFTSARVVGPRIGDASSVKMIRSVMMKGMEALTVECLLAAETAGVTAEVLASLDETMQADGWRERSDYALDRMLIHGTRRAAEMDEVVRTLEALGINPVMTRGAVAHQRAMGSLDLAGPPEGLEAKLGAVRARRKDEAA